MAGDTDGFARFARVLLDGTVRTTVSENSERPTASDCCWIRKDSAASAADA